MFLVLVFLCVCQIANISGNCAEHVSSKKGKQKIHGAMRQAIPLAVVQGGALGDMAVNKEKKKVDSNETTNDVFNSEIYQNCPDYLIEQAKLDKKLKLNGSNFNVTESAYNSTVGGALDNNRTTVTVNKTIHLLQDTPETITQPDYEPTVDQINEKSAPNKIIYIAPTNNTSHLNETITPPSMQPLEVTAPNNASISNKTITVDSNHNETANNPIQSLNEIKGNTTTVLDDAVHTSLLNKRVLLSQSYIHNLYLRPDITGSSHFRYKKNESKDMSHSVLLGPIDDMPQNPSGNGPQQKKRKDLETVNIVKGEATSSRPPKTKKKKHPKQRDRRQTSFNFDLSGMKNDPFAFALDSEKFERNNDYGDISRRTENFFQPGHAYPEEFLNKQSSPSHFVANPFLDTLNKNHNQFFVREPRKTLPEQMQYSQLPEEAVERRLPNVDDRRFTYNQQLYNDIPTTDNYDRFVEHEASNLDHKLTPKIGTPMNIDSVFNSENQQIGPPILNEEPNYKPESFLESSIQKILAENTGLQAHVPTDGMPVAFAQNRQTSLPFSEFPTKQFDSSDLSSNFNSGMLAARGAIPGPPINSESLADRFLRDRKIQTLLNQYDAQTKTLAELYKNKNVNSENDYRENLMQRSLPNLNSEVSTRSYQNENDILSDPDTRMRAESLYNNEMVRRENFERNGAVENEQANRGDIMTAQPLYNPEIVRQREDAQNALIHSNLISEFIKYVAARSNVPSESQTGFIPENNYKPLIANADVNNLPASLRNLIFQAPTQTSFIGIPRDSLPTLLKPRNTPQIPEDPPSAENSELSPSASTPTFDSVLSNEKASSGITNQQGVVMLMVTSPPEEELEGEDVKKEVVDHKELTKDGVTRSSSNVTDDDRDFSVNLKKAADFVLDKAVKDGNITTSQKDEIQHKLTHLLDKQYKNKTRGEIRASTRASIPQPYMKYCEDTMQDCHQFKAGGVCPFMRTFMRGTCRRSCDECSPMPFGELSKFKIEEFTLKKSKNIAKSPTLKRSDNPVKPSGERMNSFSKKNKIPADAVMYLPFEKASRDGVVADESANKNDAMLENGAQVSPRVLGTCGKAAELNEGSVSWSGEDFRRKPDTAITIAMWVKVRKGGIINWFANGKKGDKMFYTRTKGTVVPPKVWTHVAGTFDSVTGLARIYINGNLEQEQQQNRGQKLAKNWLVNGIGANFGDDSLHYVDEVIVYDRALANSEIRMLYNRCQFNRMILHFGFQKGNKTNIVDQSGLDNNAILIGGATQRETCDRCGYCLDLSRGPDPTMKIQQISEKQLPKYKISIAVWVSLNSTKGVHNIFTTESSEGNIGYRLQVVHGKIRWAIGTDTIPVIFDNMTRAEVVPEALWTHVIATYNNENGVTKIYANSMLKFKDIVPEKKRTTLPMDWDNDASIGDRTLRGYLDEFIMYNWELDDSEALYVRNYCADHPKLVRFTVRVPLTKKTVVPRVQMPRKSILPEPNDSNEWWYLYTKLLTKRLAKSKKNFLPKNSMNQLINISNSLSKPITSSRKNLLVQNNSKKPSKAVSSKVSKNKSKKSIDPIKAFALMKK